MRFKANTTFLCRRCPLSDGSFADRGLFDRGWADADDRSPAQYRCKRAKGVFRIMGLQVYVEEEVRKVRPAEYRIP